LSSVDEAFLIVYFSNLYRQIVHIYLIFFKSGTINLKKTPVPLSAQMLPQAMLQMPTLLAT